MAPMIGANTARIAGIVDLFGAARSPSPRNVRSVHAAIRGFVAPATGHTEYAARDQGKIKFRMRGIPILAIIPEANAAAAN